MKKLTWENFVTRTGLIYDFNDLKPLLEMGDFLKLKAHIVGDSPTAFDTSALSLLQEICLKNPAFHIITQVDTDTGKIMYDNKVRLVNRNSYYLGNGDKSDCFSIE